MPGKSFPKLSRYFHHLNPVYKNNHRPFVHHQKIPLIQKSGQKYPSPFPNKSILNEAAIISVQEDNKYRYLHFAMADGNVIHEDKCKRKDGSETIDYTLMIDLKKLNEDLSNGRFARRIGKYHHEILKKVQNVNI